VPVDRSTGIELEFVHADGSMEAAAARQIAVVVKQVGFALVVHNPGMIREAAALCGNHAFHFEFKSQHNDAIRAEIVVEILLAPEECTWRTSFE
jgi:hypothetical protein